MCGIVGFFNCGSKGELVKAVAAVSHRGPDFQGHVWFETMNSGLGHARLSIIDLSATANQPISTQSDTEVILKSYHAWGNRA